jgi:hypothetical protein
VPPCLRPTLCNRHEPRPKHQPIAGDRHCIRVARLGITGQPPFAALPVGDFGRILTKDHSVEAFLVNSLASLMMVPLRSRTGRRMRLVAPAFQEFHTRRDGPNPKEAPGWTWGQVEEETF